MIKDRLLLGIAIMLGFCILAWMADVIAKILGGSTPLIQLLFVRFIAQMVILRPILWSTKLPVIIPPRFFWLMVLHTLRYLPMADAIAIAFLPVLLSSSAHFP